jgi:hypothetical protein
LDKEKLRKTLWYASGKCVNVEPGEISGKI